MPTPWQLCGGSRRYVRRRRLLFRTERIDYRTCALDANRRHQNRQVHTGLAVFHEPLPATLDWPQQTDGIQKPVAQRSRPNSLLHLIRLVGEATRPKQSLEERKEGVQAEVLPRDDSLFVDVVTNKGR